MSFLENLFNRMRAWKILVLALSVSIAITALVIHFFGEHLIEEHLRDLLFIGLVGSILAPILLIMMPVVLFLAFRTGAGPAGEDELMHANAEKEQARKGMDLLRRAIDTVPLGVTLADAEGTIIYTNPAEARIHGYDIYEILGSKQGMFAPPERRRGFTQEELGSFRPWSRDVVNIRKDGSEVPVHLTSDIVRDSDGNPRHIINVSEDITDRQLRDRALKETLEEKDVLLKEVHHRVKNNLMIIHSLLTLQLSAVKDEGVRGLLEDSRGRIKALSIVHEVLYQDENLSRLDLKSYVRRLADSLKQTFIVGQKLISVETSVEVEDLGLDDTIPCGLIINELVSNSFRHAFSGLDKGTVAIGLREEGGTVNLKVRDDGVGLPEGFNPEEATTLGMRVVSALVSQLDGSLHLEGGKGACFNMSFPKNRQGG